MKHFVFSLVTFATLLLFSCSSPDPQALLDKIKKNPQSLTQKDYSAMIDYLENRLSDPEKLEEVMANEKESEYFMTFSFALAAAEESLDSKNKKRCEALQKKSEQAFDDTTEEIAFKDSDVMSQAAEYDKLTRDFDEVFECERYDGVTFLFAIQPETGEGYYLSPGGEIYELTITKENSSRTNFETSVAQRNGELTKMKFKVQMSDDWKDIEGSWTGVDGNATYEFVGKAR